MEDSRKSNAKESKRYSGVLVKKIENKNNVEIRSDESIPPPKKKPEPPQ